MNSDEINQPVSNSLEQRISPPSADASGSVGDDVLPGSKLESQRPAGLISTKKNEPELDSDLQSTPLPSTQSGGALSARPSYVVHESELRLDCYSYRSTGPAADDDELPSMSDGELPTLRSQYSAVHPNKSQSLPNQLADRELMNKRQTSLEESRAVELAPISQSQSRDSSSAPIVSSSSHGQSRMRMTKFPPSAPSPVASSGNNPLAGPSLSIENQPNDPAPKVVIHLDQSENSNHQATPSLINPSEIIIEHFILTTSPITPATAHPIAPINAAEYLRVELSSASSKPGTGSSKEIQSLSPHIWPSIPKLILQLMVDYMDAHTLSRFGGTDKLNHSLCTQHDIWLRIVKQPCTYGQDYHPDFLSILQPRRYYIGRYQFELERIKSKQIKFEKEIDHALRERRGYAVHYLTDYLFTPIITILFVLAFILLVWELQTKGHATIVALWPLLALLAFITLLTPIFCFQRHADKHIRPLSKSRWIKNAFRLWLIHRLPENFYESSTSPIKHAMQEINEQSWSQTAHLAATIIYLSLVTFIFLFILRITDVIRIDYGGVFAPFYLVALLLLFGNQFQIGWRYWNDERTKERWRKGWIGLVLPLSIFIVLLHLKLQYTYDIRSFYVMIPLFYFDGLTLIFLGWQIYDNDYDRGDLFFVTLGWLLVDGPLIVFKILLGYKLDFGFSIDYAVLFIPLMVSVVLVILLGCAVTIEVYQDAEYDWVDIPKKSPDLDIRLIV